MNKQQETAEAYVREKLPELMEFRKGCFLKNEKAIDWAQTVELVCYNPSNGLCHFAEPDGSVFSCHHKTYDIFKILGHPIQLHHWLSVLGEACDAKGFAFMMHDTGTVYNGDDDFDDHGFMDFNLTTGQPATESDYKAFNDIVL